MRRFMLLPFALLSFAACHAPESNDEGVAEDDLTRRSSDTFSCETTKPFYDGKVHRIKFKVFALETGSKGAELYTNDDDIPVTTTPERSPLAALSENWGFQIKGGKLVIDGDADGFFLPELVLYENSGYTRGYVAIKDHGSLGADQYSTIKCKIAHSGGSAASTEPTLRVPVIDDNGKLLSAHNAELRKKGAAELPDVIEYRAATAYRDFEALQGKIEAASEALGIDIEPMRYAIPAAYVITPASKSICYTGDPKKVVDLLGTMGDGAFSDQFSIWAWKAKDETGFYEEGSEDPSTYGAEWSKFDPKGNDVLVMTSTSDDGGERTPNLIPKCR